MQFQKYLTFSAILKLHKYKKTFQSKEKEKNLTFRNTKCVF